MLARTRFGWTLSLVGAVLLLGTMMPESTPAALAQATPTAMTGDVPAPEACQVAPRAFPLFPAGVGQRAAATPAPVVLTPQPPFSPPAGSPADAETVAVVTATVREAVACRNAGDLLRASALFTEKMLVSLYGGPATIDPEFRDSVVNGPRILPPERRLAIVSIDSVTLLPDGRVGAIVETRTGRRDFRDYLVFAQDSATGHWLIDEARVMG
jgi:hypothetical protein